MLTSLFRNNQPISFIFLAILMIFLWYPSFHVITKIPVNNTMPLYELYIRGANHFPIIHNIVAILLIIGEAVLLNYILNRFDILPRKTLFPALFYCLVMSCSKPMLHFYPLLFSNLFILLAIYKICLSYRAEEAFATMFDAGFFVSIASLFYFPTLIIFPLIWVALIVIRPFIWREWVISFLGLLLLYLFTIVYYFVTDKMNFFLYDKIFFPSAEAFISLNHQRSSFLAMSAMLLVLLVISFLKIMGGWTVNTILSKNLVVVLFWLMGLGILSYLMAPVFNISYLALLAIPFCVFVSNYYITIRFTLIGDILFSVFIFTVFWEVYY